jgi:CheY-like chemotaxis protein
VLVVDNSAVTADSMAILLRIHGYGARAVYSATDALDAAIAYCPQAIILEICMPILDGFELGRRIRSHGDLRDVVVVAVTGYAGHPGNPHADEDPFDHYLLKPVDMNELDDLLREALTPDKVGKAPGSDRHRS